MKKKDKNFAKKVATSVIALMCVCGITVGGVLALLHAESEGDNGGLQNTFTSSEGLIEKTTDSIKDPADPNNELQFWLNENKVEQDEKGNYQMVDGQFTKTNEYKELEEGMTLDKNPMLTVNLKEKQRAYVYVVMTDTTAGAVDKISIGSKFIELGKSTDGTKALYVYTAKRIEGASVVVGVSGDEPELKNVKLLSSEQDLKVMPSIVGKKDLKMNFDAYVVQSRGYENGTDVPGKKQDAINAFKAAYKDKAAEFGL